MWVSALLRMVFPAPTETAGWPIIQRLAQFYALCVFALLAVEHLVLHWNWVCSVIATRIVRSSSRPDGGVHRMKKWTMAMRFSGSRKGSTPSGNLPRMNQQGTLR
jgi:hypothetical protein